jgi:hypothetical protein
MQAQQSSSEGENRWHLLCFGTSTLTRSMQLLVLLSCLIHLSLVAARVNLCPADFWDELVRGVRGIYTHKFDDTLSASVGYDLATSMKDPVSSIRRCAQLELLYTIANLQFETRSCLLFSNSHAMFCDYNTWHSVDGYALTAFQCGKRTCFQTRRTLLHPGQQLQQAALCCYRKAQLSSESALTSTASMRL